MPLRGSRRARTVRRIPHSHRPAECRGSAPDVVLGARPFDLACSASKRQAAPFRPRVGRRARRSTTVPSSSSCVQAATPGTGVSSAWSFSAAITWRSIAPASGSSRAAGLSNPIGQCRALQMHALALVDAALSIQRQVVCVLRYQHMGEQPRTRQAAGNRSTGCFDLRNRLAATRKPSWVAHAESL